MKCQSCGTENANNSKFCMKCGTSLNNVISVNNNTSSFSSNQQNATDVNKKKTGRNLLIIFSVLLIIILLIIFGIKALLNKINSFSLFKINNIPSIINKFGEDKLPESLRCTGDNCRELKVYFLSNVDGNLEADYETYYVENGTVLDVNTLVDYINKMFGNNFIKTDGETFTLMVGEFSINIGWYYKGTDKKFNFNEPITEDIEIEMKMFDGEVDNEFLKKIYDIFRGYDEE